MSRGKCASEGPRVIGTPPSLNSLISDGNPTVERVRHRRCRLQAADAPCEVDRQSAHGFGKSGLRSDRRSSQGALDRKSLRGCERECNRQTLSERPIALGAVSHAYDYRVRLDEALCAHSRQISRSVPPLRLRRQRTTARGRLTTVAQHSGNAEKICQFAPRCWGRKELGRLTPRRGANLCHRSSDVTSTAG